MRHHAVDRQRGESKRPSQGCHLTWVKDVSSYNCDAYSVGIVFLRAYLADGMRVTVISLLVEGGVFISDDFEGVCSFHSLFSIPLSPFPMPWHRHLSLFT